MYVYHQVCITVQRSLTELCTCKVRVEFLSRMSQQQRWYFPCGHIFFELFPRNPCHIIVRRYRTCNKLLKLFPWYYKGTGLCYYFVPCTPHRVSTFWRRNFFFQILAHPVFKMWVIQKPKKVALWNKRHFEEKKWRLYSMFKIFSTDICWINIKLGIYRVILRPSYIWDARFLKVNSGRIFFAYSEIER